MFNTASPAPVSGLDAETPADAPAIEALVLAAFGPGRYAKTAERLWALMQREGEAFGSQMTSPEAMEAFMAFSQKRAPDFSKVG